MEAFLSACKLKFQHAKNLNPQGYRFPKYLAFSKSELIFTLMKTVEVQDALAKGAYRFQRYIIPERFEAWKKVIWWRRRKVTKYYHVKTRLALKAKKGVETMAPFVAVKFLDQHDNLQAITNQVSKGHAALALELCYVTTLRFPKSCDAKQSRHASEECEKMTTTVKRLIEQYGLGVQEELEELVLGLVRGVDEMWYFLNCNRGRTKDSEGLIAGKSRTRHYKTLSFEELTERIYNHKQIENLPQIRLPELNIRSLPSTAKGLFPSLPSSKSTQALPTTHSRYLSHDFVVDHIDAVASRMDQLRIQSQILKKTFKSKQTGKLSGYPPSLLSRIMRKLYETVLRDPKLARYFPDRERVHKQVSGAVQNVLMQGGSHLILRKIHQQLSIEDSDFDKYVGYFLATMEGEGVSEEELITIQQALEGFREDIVAKKGYN